MNKVILMRGASGAGKSTYVQVNYPHANVICSNDHHRVVDGVYKYTDSKEPQKKCFKSYYNALVTGQPLVVVDNTNVSAASLAPYIALAELFGYDYTIIEIETDIETCLKNSQHGVSIDTLYKMAEQLDQPLPKEWKIKVIVR